MQIFNLAPVAVFLAFLAGGVGATVCGCREQVSPPGQTIIDLNQSAACCSLGGIDGHPINLGCSTDAPAREIAELFVICCGNVRLTGDCFD